MKYLEIFRNFKKINEISDDLRNSAISTMRRRGMGRRADEWDQYYVDKSLDHLKGKEILNPGLIIRGFSILNKELTIYYGSPLSKEFNIQNGKILYYISLDKFSINRPIARKYARTLSKIATIIQQHSTYTLLL